MTRAFEFQLSQSMSAEENEVECQSGDSKTEIEDLQQESSTDEKPLTWKDLVISEIPNLLILFI